MSGNSIQPGEINIVVLLIFLEEKGIQIHNTFEFETRQLADSSSEDNFKKLVVVLKKFDEFCQPMKNIVFEHFLKRTA